MDRTWVVLSAAGPNRDLNIDTREQTYWDEHAAFIDALTESGFILLGGPFPDEGGAMLVVIADSAESVQARLADDPWYQHGILELRSVKRWPMFIDNRV